MVILVQITKVNFIINLLAYYFSFPLPASATIYKPVLSKESSPSVNPLNRPDKTSRPRLARISNHVETI